MKVTVTIEAESLLDFSRLGKAFSALGESGLSYGLDTALISAMHNMRGAARSGAKAPEGSSENTSDKFNSGGVVKGPNLAVVCDDTGTPATLKGLQDVAPADNSVSEEVVKYVKMESTVPEKPKATRKTKAEKQLEQAADLVENQEAVLNTDGSMTILAGIDVEPAVQKMAHDILKQRLADGQPFNSAMAEEMDDQRKSEEAEKQAENAQETDPINTVAGEPSEPENETVITEDLLRRICYTLNTHGPAGKASLTVILKHVGATRFSEIPKEKYGEFYKLAMADVEQFKLTVPDEL